MTQTQAKQAELQADPLKASVEQQEKELNRVMRELKNNTPFGNHLYAQPWYLVLGLENAGKTSLINRSGQDFPVTSAMRAAGQRSENQYSFDWWIGKESVLIDPDGELLSQQQNVQGSDGALERRFWQHFIGWLGKTRSRRPLNGVILAIDFARLRAGDTAERLAYSNLLRARLKELSEGLSVQIPVYITLTKLDLLSGFEPFFRQYTKAQREDALGFTFTLDSVRDTDSWLVEFEQDYQLFVQRINGMLPSALRSSVSTSERASIYSFVRQLAGMQSVLVQFFTEALSSDQYMALGQVRGVYFTSVYQQGVPTDTYVDAAANRYRLPSAVNSAQHAKNSTVFFAKRLFSDIIYLESGLASDNPKLVSNKRKVLVLSFAACSVASALLVGSWQRTYQANIAKQNDVLAKISLYKDEVAASRGMSMQSISTILKPLDTIHDAELDYPHYDSKIKYLSAIGLDQGHTIGPKLHQVYDNWLDFHFIPLLVQRLTVDLSMAQTDGDKLNILRVLRMLTDKSARQDSVVSDYFSHIWQADFSNNPSLQQQLNLHLASALKNTDLQSLIDAGNPEAIKVMQPYHQLIAAAQRSLSNVSVAERAYHHLKQQANAELGPKLDVRTAVGPVFDLVFNERQSDAKDLLISPLFTKQGFNSYFLPQFESVSKLAAVDNWVLGDTQTKLTQAQKRALQDKIRDLYVLDYTNQWRAALHDVSFKYFVDIDDAVSVLGNLVGPQRPLTRFLDAIDGNTQVFPSLPENSQARKVLMQSAQYKTAAMISAPFQDFDSLLKKQNDQPAYITEVTASVKHVYDYLKAIQDAPDPGKAAWIAAKNRVQLTNTDPIYTLQRVAAGLPAPLNTMMNKLADESWAVVKQRAVQYINSRWQSDVYDVFENSFASHYPFNAQSGQDVSLKDFTNFFGPDGTLDSYYNTYLKVFVDAGVSLSSNDGNSLLTQQAQQEFAQAKDIQSAFFDRKGNLDVEFSLKPIELSGNLRRSVLNIDGQYVEFSHGLRRSVGLIWPNTLRDGATSSLSLVPDTVNLSPRGFAYHGPWAFFRLLDRAW